uniref:Kinase n=1 Tax=Ciona intestinalis TaxID=7719 RepID=F6ZNK2_CIOIN
MTDQPPKLHISDEHLCENGVTLEPFLHQVAGRATMMCLNDTTVCKPLNYREHFFYKSLPPDILQFTPKFKGVVNVMIEETNDGSVALTAFPYKPETVEDDIESSSTESPVSDSSEESLQKLGGAYIANVNEQMSNMFSSTCRLDNPRKIWSDIVEIQLHSYSVDGQYHRHNSDGEDGNMGLCINPWIFKVHKEGLLRHLQSKHKVIQKCILLENVASQFRKPCVLDLKMGTRIHGDFDDEEKRLRHEKKCAATTTKKLGIRLSGMQIFDASTGSFLCRDKYFGRKLDRAGLRGLLRQFFYDGCRLRRDLIRPILSRLQLILESLGRLRSYRFYSSSLLIMYDGETLESTSHIPAAPLSEQNNISPHPTPAEERSHLEIDPGVQFDVRMIDFAKSTHQEMDRSVIHDGPDHGYIFGLTNLIALLQDISKSDD